MQARLHPAIHGGTAALDEALRLLRIAALLGVPAWGTEHCPEAIGPLLPEFDGLLARRFRKTSFDACGAPEFASALDAAGHPDVVLCGYEAHVCVLQTALGMRAGPPGRAGAGYGGQPHARESGRRAGSPRGCRCGAVNAESEFLRSAG